VGSNGLIQSAAINAARFDHTSAGVCRGLLIEESRTNLTLQSENHPSASWNKTGITVASASNTAPNGDVNSSLASEDSSTGLHRLFQATAYVSGTSYSISCFLKYAGRQFVAITHPAVAANGTAIFDIQNGTITLSQAGITSSITAYPNGWYRCVVNGVSSTTGSVSHIIQGSTTGGILTGSYSGLNGPAFYIYGSQVEAGSFPTSYIPTVASSVVRSADVCSITGGDFSGFYNASEGTIIASAFIDALTGNNRGIYGINNNTASHGFLTFYNASSSGIISQSRNTASTTLSPTFTNSAGVKFTRALAYYLGGCSIATNGSAVTDTAATISTQTMLTLQIGNMLAGSFQGTCHIPSIRYYRKRLPNAKLQALTA
jgi:hypothetical protein